jgi:hypothetical protein
VQNLQQTMQRVARLRPAIGAARALNLLEVPQGAAAGAAGARVKARVAQRARLGKAGQ